MRAYRVIFVAANGDVCQHDYPHWLDAKSFIEFLRNSYTCKGYVCDNMDEFWTMGWERKEIFRKAGCPDKFIEYYRVNVEI
jgi:hypothetical protein